MDWANILSGIPSAIQTIVIISIIVALGLTLGNIKIKGISLGIAFVFFVGILAGHLGIGINPDVLMYSETFGLVLFVYVLGLSVGPNFFGSFRKEGMRLNLWSLAIIGLGTVMAVSLVPLTHINLPDMIGILCGATTNTPALGAAQQALEHLGMPSGSLALATAITYPLGVVGVILAMILLRKLFVKPTDLARKADNEDDQTYVAQFVIINPALDGKTTKEIGDFAKGKFIVSRIWRGKEVIMPEANTVFHLNDSIFIVTNRDKVNSLELFFGKRVPKDWNRDVIDWNKIDAKVESREIVLTKNVLNGKVLGKLHLRETYDVNVSRLIRGDIRLLATPNLRLQYGDRLIVVGERKSLDNVEKFLGNSVRHLEEPNLGSIFLGMVLGLVLGIIPLNFPGMDSPIRLGIAGGPIIAGILIGAFGPHFHIISYTTHSASLMLRKFGLSIYLGCLGLDAGKDFFQTLVRPEGLLWIGVGTILTIIPIFVIGLIILKRHEFDFGTICGIMCGSMANPMALTYADDTIEGDTPSVSYATVYPLGMFIRVLIAQLLVVFLV